MEPFEVRRFWLGEFGSDSTADWQTLWPFSEFQTRAVKC